MRVSIHQPNFMPWLPYFQKIQMCDVFVVMVNCQFEKNGYQNRFNIGEKWYTMSVNKGLDPICEKRYVNPMNDWKKIKNQLGNKLDIFDDCIGDSLWKTNYDIICSVSKMFGFKTKICLDEPTTLRSTDRLIEICKRHNATTYVAGSSGTKYMEMDKFSDNGIEVICQKILDCDRKPLIEML